MVQISSFKSLMGEEIIQRQRATGELLPVCSIDFMQVLTKWQTIARHLGQHDGVALQRHQSEAILDEGAIVHSWGGRTIFSCYGHCSTQLAQPVQVLLDCGCKLLETTFRSRIPNGIEVNVADPLYVAAFL